jgi:quercetin dioxygenase-like cupin family protein
MKIADYKEINCRKVEEQGAEGVAIRWVISKEDGAKNFYMRVFDVQPGGFTPHHRHEWEHEVFILEGTATVVSDKGTHAAPAGSVVFVLPNEIHQFRNETGALMRFICLIPRTD